MEKLTFNDILLYIKAKKYHKFNPNSISVIYSIKSEKEPPEYIEKDDLVNKYPKINVIYVSESKPKILPCIQDIFYKEVNKIFTQFIKWLENFKNETEHLRKEYDLFISDINNFRNAEITHSFTIGSISIDSEHKFGELYIDILKEYLPEKKIYDTFHDIIIKPFKDIFEDKWNEIIKSALKLFDEINASKEEVYQYVKNIKKRQIDSNIQEIELKKKISEYNSLTNSYRKRYDVIAKNINRVLNRLKNKDLSGGPL